MIVNDRTVKIGDVACLLGDPDRGVVQRVYGPEVDVLFEFTSDEGIERSEYYGFKCYGLTWNEITEIWDIDPESKI